MKTESPAPLVSDEQIRLRRPMPMTAPEVRDIYEAHLTTMRAERDELVGAYKRLLVRFEEATGERPHAYCGCTYCESTALLSKYKTE